MTDWLTIYYSIMRRGNMHRAAAGAQQNGTYRSSHERRSNGALPHQTVSKDLVIVINIRAPFFLNSFSFYCRIRNRWWNNESGFTPLLKEISSTHYIIQDFFFHKISKFSNLWKIIKKKTFGAGGWMMVSRVGGGGWIKENFLFAGIYKKRK